MEINTKFTFYLTSSRVVRGLHSLLSFRNWDCDLIVGTHARTTTPTVGHKPTQSISTLTLVLPCLHPAVSRDLDQIVGPPGGVPARRASGW